MKKWLLLTLLLILPITGHAAIYAVNSNGVVTTIPDLDTAATGVSYSGSTIHVTSAYSVNSVVFNSDRNMVMEKGAAITTVTATFPHLKMESGSTLSNSGAVSIIGSFDADSSEHFLSTGAITFSSVQIINPQWWGAKPNNTDGSYNTTTTAWQLALNAAINRELRAPDGTYKIVSTLTVNYTLGLPTGITIGGVGNGTVLKWAGAASTPMLSIYGTGGLGFYGKTTVEKLTLQADADGTGVIGIQLGKTADTTAGVGNVTIQDNYIQSCSTGIKGFFESDEVTIERNHIRSFSAFGVDNTTASSGWRIINNHLQGGLTGSVGIKSGGSAITIRGNVIQNMSEPTTAMYLNTINGYTVANNYMESMTGPTYAIGNFGCNGGNIYGNKFGGYPNASLIYFDSASKSSVVGPNSHSASGGNPTALVNIITGATGIVISGPQTTDVVSTILGVPSVSFDSTTYSKFYTGLSIISGDATIGPAGTGATMAQLVMAGSSASGRGGVIDFQRNDVSGGRIGSSSAILGGAGNYLTAISGATGGVYLNTNGTSWSAVSDERKKDIIEPITDAVAKLSKIRTIIGKYKLDPEGTRRSFVLAQDIQKVFPEAVNTQADDDQTLGVQYSDLIPLIISAINELNTKQH